METHVKVLAVLQIAIGALGLVGAVAAMMISGVLAGLVSASGEPGSEVAAPIIGLVGALVITVLLVLSIPAIIVGAGLLKFRPWARIFGIILSILLLIHFPLGTVVGVYGLWVLLTGETERLFAAKAGTT
jgi:uncharacterized membrane protein YvlD (DUF360 family)